MTGLECAHDDESREGEDRRKRIGPAVCTKPTRLASATTRPTAMAMLPSCISVAGRTHNPHTRPLASNGSDLVGSGAEPELWHASKPPAERGGHHGGLDCRDGPTRWRRFRRR